MGIGGREGRRWSGMSHPTAILFQSAPSLILGLSETMRDLEGGDGRVSPGSLIMAPWYVSPLVPFCFE